MHFELTHLTKYVYSSPALESVGELRVFPVNDFFQRVTERKLEIRPSVPVDTYIDYFGNRVEWFAIPVRHEKLTIRSHSRVQTSVPDFPNVSRKLSVAETAQIARRQQPLFDFLSPSRNVPVGLVLRPLNHRFVPPAAPMEETLVEITRWIYENFRYTAGATDVNTPLAELIETREGVCQDFAHLMLSILRTAGIPCRYVSGYIEPFDPTVADRGESELVGAAASHAWVEVWFSGANWIGYDPTNNQAAGERHIRVAVGRDYSDVPPFRGTFKGAAAHQLTVEVEISRIGEASSDG